MSSIWDTKLTSLKHLKLCFTDPVRYLQHIRSVFITDTLLDVLQIRIHYYPKSSKGYFEDYNLECVVSIARILDRNYTQHAKKALIETDMLVFDVYLDGFRTMPVDLCFGSRLPTLEQNSLDHSAAYLQKHYKF